MLKKLFLSVVGRLVIVIVVAAIVVGFFLSNT